MNHDFKDFGLCMMPYGVDKDTGYPLYLLTRQRFAVVLPKCEGCGETNVLSAPLGTWPGKAPNKAQLCYECLNRYNSFKSQCNRLDSWSSEKTLNSLIEKIEWYKLARSKDHWVPQDLDQRIAKANRLAPYILERAAEQQRRAEMITQQRADKRVDGYNKTNYCSYCMKRKAVRLRNENTGNYICLECEERKKRFNVLSKRYDRLTIDECNEMNSILDKYAELLKKDGLTPDIPKARKAVTKRMKDLAN